MNGREKPLLSSPRIVAGFPIPKHTPVKKSVTPFKKSRNSSRASSRPSQSIISSAHKTVTNEEFSTMLEIPETVSSDSSLLGQSLYDLSLDLRSLNDVLNQIKMFKIYAPLQLYRYISAIELLRAAAKCPPDTILLLLSVPKRMIKAENYAKPVYLNELIKITQEQINGRYKYSTYKDQRIPQQKLRKLLEIFRKALTMEKKEHEGNLKTSEIEFMIQKKMELQKKEQEEKEKVEKEKSQPGTPKRKLRKARIKRTKDDPLIKKINHKISPPPTPKNTPPPSPGASRIGSFPDSKKKKRGSKKIKTDENEQNIEQSITEKVEDTHENNNEKVDEDIKPGLFTIHEEGDNSSDFPKPINKDFSKSLTINDSIRKLSKFTKSASSSEVPIFPSIRNNSSISRELRLAADFDLQSSSLNSSSFLNIVGSALNDIDDTASQATTQSGINSISKELRDVLFNDESTGNEDAYLRAKKLATVNTYDAADYETSDNNLVHSRSEISIFFKEEEDLNDLDFLRTPSSCSFASVVSANTNDPSGSRLITIQVQSNNQENGENGENENIKSEDVKNENKEIVKNPPKIVDMDSLSEEPDSIDDDEDNLTNGIITLNASSNQENHKGNNPNCKFNPQNLPKLGLENIASLSEGSKISTQSPGSMKLSTGTHGSLSSDYSSTLSPRHLDSTGVLGIIDRKPTTLEESNQVHIDIEPEKNMILVTSPAPSETISFMIPVPPPRQFNTLRDISDENGNNLRLSLSRSPKYKSIERFLLSKDNIYQRRTRGAKLYDGLSKEQIEQISELAKLFTAWSTAYINSKTVWDIMKNDDTFDIDILLSQIPVSYGDFLIEGLKTFAKTEGIHIKEIVSPR